MTNSTTDTRDLLKEKRELINNLLNDDHVLVHLDGSAEGVELPGHLQGRTQVTLKMSRMFKGGVEIENDKIIADLLFDRSYFCCQVPLVAVWGTTSARGAHTLWPESAPKEVLAKILQSSIAAAPAKKLEEEPLEEKAATKPAAKKTRKKPTISSIAGAKAGQAKKESVKPKDRPSFLKRVK